MLYVAKAHPQDTPCIQVEELGYYHSTKSKAVRFLLFSQFQSHFFICEVIHWQSSLEAASRWISIY